MLPNKITDLTAWKPLTINSNNLVHELSVNQEVLFRISSMEIIRHPNLFGLAKINWTIDYKMSNGGAPIPMMLLSCNGPVSKVSTNANSVLCRNEDIAYWVNLARRATIIDVASGNFTGNPAQCLYMHINKNLSKNIVTRISLPAANLVSESTGCVHKTTYGLVDNELVLISKDLIITKLNVSEYSIPGVDFIWGDGLFTNAVKMHYGDEVVINKYTQKGAF